jgi:hypothetical protein
MKKKPKKKPPTTAARLKAFGSMDEAALAGEPDSTLPQGLEIACGEDCEDRPGLSLFWVEPFAIGEDGHIRSAIPADVGGGRLIIPAGSTKAEAIRSLVQMKLTVERYWGGMRVDPEILWAMVYDIRTNEYDNDKKNPPPAPDPDKPATWPEDRRRAAMEVFNYVGGMYLMLRATREERQAFIQKWLEKRPEMARDTVVWVDDFIGHMDKWTSRGSEVRRGK